MSPRVRYGVRLSVDLDGWSRLDAAVAELLQEHKQPPVARNRGAWLVLGQVRASFLEARPRADQAVVRADDRLVQGFVRGQPVVLPAQAAELLVSVAHSLQQLRGQQSPFGADRLELTAPAQSAGLGSST